MKQEHGVVHRGRELQDITDVVCDIRDFAEEDVRAFIDRDGTADDREEQYGFEIGCRREKKNEEDEYDDDDHDHRHFLLDVLFDELVCRGHTDQVTAVADQLVDLCDGLVGTLRGIAFIEGDIHDGVSVLIVIIDIIVVDEFRRAVDVCR